MEQKDWVKVFSTGESHLAELIRGMLQENQIESIILNKKDSAYGFGEVEVYALRDDALKASHLIKATNF